MNDLTPYIKRTNDGNVDIKATMVDIRALVERTAAAEKIEHETIDKAVRAVFTEYPDTVWTMEPLSAYAARKMGSTPANHKEIVERIQNYIRNAEKSFLVSRGRGGIKLLETGQAA